VIFSAAAPPVTQFLQSLLLGVLLSVLYDLFYAVRCLFPVRMQAHIVLDLLYFVLFGVLLFNFLLTETAGRLRYFIILGVIIGWGVYHATMSRLTVRFFNGFIGGVRAVLRAVFRPVIALARWISLRLRDLCKKGTAKCKSAKNRLKKHHRMRYNKVSNRYREENGREKAYDHQADQPYSGVRHRFSRSAHRRILCKRPGTGRPDGSGACRRTTAGKRPTGRK
jgi:hypothetical protein